MLKFAGFQVIDVADNGRDAVNKFESFSEKPDIILMDHRMPIKNGIEATKEILEIDNKTKIIFVSADKSVRENALLVGAICFKEKPCTYKRLVNNIQKALKGKIIII